VVISILETPDVISTEFYYFLKARDFGIWQNQKVDFASVSSQHFITHFCQIPGQSSGTASLEAVGHTGARRLAPVKGARAKFRKRRRL